MKWFWRGIFAIFSRIFENFFPKIAKFFPLVASALAGTKTHITIVAEACLKTGIREPAPLAASTFFARFARSVKSLRW